MPAGNADRRSGQDTLVRAPAEKEKRHLWPWLRPTEPLSSRSTGSTLATPAPPTCRSHCSRSASTPGRAPAQPQARQPLTPRLAQDGRPPPPTAELPVPHRARPIPEADRRSGIASLDEKALAERRASLVYRSPALCSIRRSRVGVAAACHPRRHRLGVRNPVAIHKLEIELAGRTLTPRDGSRRWPGRRRRARPLRRCRLTRHGCVFDRTARRHRLFPAHRRIRRAHVRRGQDPRRLHQARRSAR